MNLLTVKNLSISTGTTDLVKHVTFSLAPGERVGLIGESGSGKSLTAAAIMGLLPPELVATGSVELEGADGNLLTESDRRMARLRGKDMSQVFQEPMSALNPLMRVGQQVAEVMKLHGNPVGTKVVELLASVDLPNPEAAAKAYPHQLSGGQRQRVVIAMALANRPRLLICDEPTTALDVTVQASILDLIDTSVRTYKTGLLFITHDLVVVSQVCDRVLVMYRGEVVEEGAVADVFANPQHEYTAGLLAASNLTGGATSGQSTHTGGVEVTNVTKVYERKKLLMRPQRVEALKGVSLRVEPGQRFGIVGESGSGKSTLLKIVAGLEEASSGDVVVDGTPVTGGSAKELARVRSALQIVFQDPFASLDPRMKVRDIVAEPLVAQGVSARERMVRVRETLSAVGLDDSVLERYPHQFSGGQRQRISIARALVVKSAILVADEPVSALDVSVRAHVLNLLTDLVDEYGLTLIFVSHDLSVVRYLCSDVAVMKDGQIVETGTVATIYDNPTHPYTQQLVNATPHMKRPRS